MSRTRLLLADDHLVVLEGLSRHLESDFDIVAKVNNMESMMEAAKKRNPDLIVLVLSMTSMNSFKALKQLQAMASSAKVIVLTIDTDLADIVMAFELGASAFVSKAAASSDLKTAIREVLEGRIYISPSIRVDLPQLSMPPYGEASE